MQQLAARIERHVQQLKRYEVGSSQPALNVIRKRAVTLGIASDQYFSAKTNLALVTSSGCSSKP